MRVKKRPKNERGALRNDFAIAGLVLAVAALMLYWFYLAPVTQRADRETRASARALRLALERYSAGHHGVYPASRAVTGGGRADILIKSRCIAFYPKNPYHPNRRMKNIADGAPVPGDFTYIRSEIKKYKFRLTVYGRRGAIYRFSSIE